MDLETLTKKIDDIILEMKEVDRLTGKDKTAWRESMKAYILCRATKANMYLETNTKKSYNAYKQRMELCNRVIAKEFLRIQNYDEPHKTKMTESIQKMGKNRIDYIEFTLKMALELYERNYNGMMLKVNSLMQQIKR